MQLDLVPRTADSLSIVDARSDPAKLSFSFENWCRGEYEKFLDKIKPILRDEKGRAQGERGKAYME